MANTKAAATAALREQVKQHMDNISAAIEKEGQLVFAGSNVMNRDEVTDFTNEFLELMVALLESENPFDDAAPAFHALEIFFNNLSRKNLVRGGRIEDMARYIQFIQRTFLESLEEDKRIGFDDLRNMLMFLANLFNEVTLSVFQAYLETNERTIRAQREELRETSTPITEIWDGVLTLPIIGTLDSSRTMLVMESLLNRIASDRASAVVMDVTGVRSIDSQVSHHLIQMVRAIQLMGAEAILTGIRPEIARALTSLNIDLGNVTTRASLSDGLKEAFRRMGVQVSAKP